MIGSLPFRSLPQLLKNLFALFYPEVCQICRAERAGAAESYVCGRCRSAIRYIEAPLCECCGLPFEGEITVSFECANCHDQQLHFRSARAAVELSGPIQDTVHRYKYSHATWFEPFLADLLIACAKPVLAQSQWDYILPIPLHWLKRRERSFNQAQRLAGHLSRATGIPLAGRLLKRVEPTSTQTRLTRAQRTENVKRAFAYGGRGKLAGARIVLVDDVLTTGATASACAKLLMHNGAGVVDVWTVARGILK
jgi:competence protein ComFC